MTPIGGNVELRLRAAVESSPAGILMTDAEGRIVLVNREVERLFGYSREELLGRPVDLLVPERFRSGHPGFRSGFLSEPRVRAMGAGRDLYGLRKDGREVPVEIGLTPLVTDEGIFVLSSVVDISARKQAEARFRAAVESSPNGMVMIDSEGRIVLLNREVERMFGYDREELLGRPIEILVPERFRGRHPQHRSAFYADPATRAMGGGRDLYGVRKDGTEIPVEIGLNPIETDEGLFVLGSIVDISARKLAEEERAQLEQDLRQAQKLEAVGTLAGGIAHDFNNILGAVLGYAEMIQSELPRESALQADVGELLKSVERGRQLVQRILAFSRRQETSRRPLALNQTVEDAVKLLRATLPASIQIRPRLDPGAPRILADATSLQQVIMNLATNSAHAMPDGGVLDIATAPLYVRDSNARAHPELREGPYGLVEVRDGGHGMPPDVVQRAFEPFFTTKGRGEGSGLGLAMVHAIVQDHEGTVELRSEVGRGTVVRCLFPAIEAEPAEAGEPDRSVPSGAGERVLYVDDEPALARIGERRLRDLGYRVTVMTDSLEALEQFRSDPDAFDLVVTDYFMPRLTGVELARQITGIRPGIPILLQTGFVEDLPEETLRAAGVRGLLSKPVSILQLAEGIRDVLKA